MVRPMVSLPHGSADRNFGQSLEGAVEKVAPSRERGSKRRLIDDRRPALLSLPHGSADRNHVQAGVTKRSIGSLPHGSADRNTVTSNGVDWYVESLPHGSADRNRPSASVIRSNEVAPSRERGSKRPISSCTVLRSAKSLPHGSADRNTGKVLIDLIPKMSLPHGSADRNMNSSLRTSPGCGRPLTGARVETARGS